MTFISDGRGDEQSKCLKFRKEDKELGKTKFRHSYHVYGEGSDYEKEEFVRKWEKDKDGEKTMVSRKVNIRRP